MPLLVVGSVALDSVHTPREAREDVLGGSAVYFSYAASFFTSVRLVGVVGEDWPHEHTQFLQSRRIDTSGLQVIPGGKTFRWRGKYATNMNDRQTLEVHLNVLGDFDPVLPDGFKRCPYVFLANGSPRAQMKVLDQVTGPRLVVADTMDLWIRETHDELMQLFRRVDGLVMNDSEAKLLTGDENLVRAGHRIRELGPKFVVIKKGEHGAMFFSQYETYVLPAFPTEQVVDPTGAGDSFAGGMMGYLSERDDFEPRTLKKAMAYGILVASFNVEDFSLDRMKVISREDLEFRLRQYERMLSF
ncbi:MAG: PfkB family carbohydrate kinase [Pirellulaceae bacterium]|jgi:sugar/nucleoside kinase (ribokinase family)|nr:PfkB family carbohydrate kinase [Pirellulaceae bacterium]MCU0978561.1 PfkB family carbohydrate kinase [Pirellulaceae bacterium]